MNIGFTGTRKGMTEPQAGVLVRLLERATTLHHGGALGGDSEADAIANTLGIATIAHLPRGHRPTDYLDRNREIVDTVDELLAAPGSMREERRSGTWATVRYARRTRRSITIVWPDGTVSCEPCTPSTP